MLNPLNKLGNSKKYITLGAEIMAALLGPVILGWYIDIHFNVAPWGLISGVVLGFIGVMTLLIKVIRDI